jgi:mRNA interferase HigB
MRTCKKNCTFVMKIHLVKKQTIINYALNNAQSRELLDTWLGDIKKANWNKPEDIWQKFGSADLLGNGTDRVVFDVGGNRYRIICQYFFGENEVHLFVRWIGTHTHYSKLCSEGRQYTIRNF